MDKNVLLGTDFSKILFLDNFYVNLNVENEDGSTVLDFLKEIINTTENTFIKRSACKIICELTAVNVIKNRYSSLGVLFDFLSSNTNELIDIALKQLPFFIELLTSEIEHKVIDLTDHDNGDISSQAYFFLGIKTFFFSMSKNDFPNFISTISEAEKYFLAAENVMENRNDAQFYIMLIQLTKALLSNDQEGVTTTVTDLYENLQLRALYDFDTTGLEFEYLIFQMFESLNREYKIVSRSQEWLDVRQETQMILEASLEIEKLKLHNSKFTNITKKIVEESISKIESNIYNFHLYGERKRLIALQSQSDKRLVDFIDSILQSLPNHYNGTIDDNEVLAMLVEFMGAEEGLEIYNKIQKKELSFAKAIGQFIKNNYNSNLSIRTGSLAGEEIFNVLMREIDTVLPEYPKEKRKTFSDILEEVIRYCQVTFVGNEKKRFPFLYSTSAKGKGAKASEQDLQDSMILYFEHSIIADGLEHEKSKFVDGGRVDIVYKKDIITVPIELKKSLLRPDKDMLEENYIAQAQTYTAGYDQLGIFVLLEMSDKSKEPMVNFKDWFKIHHLRPSTGQEVSYPDYIISVVIPGNRTSPSSKSTYK